MENRQVEALLAAQRGFFRTGATLPVEYRIQALNKLYRAIESRQDEIHAALKQDLGKSDYEGFM